MRVFPLRSLYQIRTFPYISPKRPARWLATFLLILLLTACGKYESSTDVKGVAANSSTTEQSVEFTPSIDPDALMATITELASDEFGGRGPMSEGEKLTLELIENRFRELGL